jgi:hypothetical protein
MQVIYIFPPDEIPQAASLRVEDSQWQNLVAPIPLTLRWPQPFAFEQFEDASNLETGLDFSESLPLVAPCFVNTVPQVFTADDIFVAPQPTLALEEDWNVKPAPVASYTPPRVFVADDETQIVPPAFDEDFWINPVAPIFAYAVRVFSDDELIQIAAPIQGEDYWQSGVAPVAASIFLRAPDVDEQPGVFFVSAEPDVLGSGAVAVVCGGGSVTEVFGAGQAGVASGGGRIN